MSDDTGSKPAPSQPHIVKAGTFDAWFGNKGPNGELMYRGKPLLLADVPPDAGDEDDD